MNARGDIRKRISRGERARGPVIMRFVTTVCLLSVNIFLDQEATDGKEGVP